VFFLRRYAERACHACEWQVGTGRTFTGLLRDLYSDAQAPGRTTPYRMVQTIHRAKGLEFDHVLVPGLDRSVGGGVSDPCCTGSTCRASAAE